uniref:Dockerin domain-containing protein n=1 Tax=Candidatus Methanogaster sp. ANME-2c ERB4 TaxID=2759911 RepID=A0A7G9YK64_9EURY|nr:hypothetical protein OODJKIFO_00002 [Methanosarcinales archaeon ANME-2c ERB4]QNO48485.1 hypothetical protein FBNIIKBJ_00010 [Methanosarcinales archaeon ANME-2c ERB4]
MNRNTKCVLIGFFVLMFVGCACADALPFSGEVVQLTGAQTEDIVWDENNFGGFCYDINGSVGTETLTVAAGTLTGPDIDRTIETDALTYTTSPFWREYELHKNLGLTVESENYGGDSGYWIEFWMGERYVAINGRSSELAKPLVEFNDTDTKTLVTGEEWDLGGGFSLNAMQIDLEGDKVWFILSRNGKELDSEVIDTGDADLQERVYTYIEDVASEDDVPVFSCYVSGILRGTDSNIVQVKYVFLIDNDATEIDTGDTYGVMEVVTASSSGVILKNNVTINLIPNTTTPIMGNLSFKTTDSTSAIEFYPHLIRDELPVLSGGGGFALDDCWIGSEWGLYEDYSIAAKDVDLDGDKARIVLLKNGTVVDERILTEESIAPVDSDSHYVYVKDGTEIINATMRVAFRGDVLNAVELVGVHQCSEMGGSILINNESYLFKSSNPTGIPWDLADDYVLTMKDVGFSDEVLLELSKNDTVMKETILDESSVFTYTTGIGAINFVVDRVLYGCEANAVKLVNVNQYSDVNGTVLLSDESHFYKTADPTVLQWELLNGHVLTMKDIEEVGWYGGGNKVWLELSRDGSVVKDDILESDDFFVYEMGAEIVNCTVDAVFRGTLGDVVKLVDANQYTEMGRQLIDRGSKTFATANPTGDAWDLYEGYSLNAKDIDLDGNKVWLSLSKNGVVVEGAIIDEDGWFKHYNSTGALVFSTYVYDVFCGTDFNIAQLKYVSQYSEIDGSVLMMFGEDDKKTLYAGTATTIFPSITTPIDGQIFVDGDVITFSASASDGTAPYTYTWYEDGSIIGTGDSFDVAFGTGSHPITLIITDTTGTSVSDRARVEIKSRGDVNRDGGITTVDALIVSQMAVSGEYDPFADVSGDGKITSLDTLMILQAAAGNIDL